MIIGVPKEIKADEYRVAVVPAGVEVLARAGHTVLVEAGAGVGTGVSDAEYAEHGAEVVAGAGEVWGRAELIVKVKEPLEPEFPLIRRGQVLFTYFHFAASEAAHPHAAGEGRRLHRVRDHPGTGRHRCRC